MAQLSPRATLTVLSCLGTLSQVQLYRKIPKINPGAYIFQRPFLGGLFLERLIFGGAYLRREICVYKSVGLALQLEANLPFLCCFTLYLRATFKVHAPGGLTFGGAIYRRVFCVTGSVGGLTHGGAYFRNFTVIQQSVPTEPFTICFITIKRENLLILLTDSSRMT